MTILLTILGYFVLALALYYVTTLTAHLPHLWLRLVLNTACIGVYAAIAWFFLRRRPVPVDELN